MLIRNIRLLSFRAHPDSTIHFAPKINLLYGPNGAGKTNVLEAIHYLCLSKSFVASQDNYALRKDHPYFELEGFFEGESRPELRVRLVYVPEQGKSILLNRAPLERFAQIVGLLPVVVFSPEDHALTAGGPEERRKFLNNVLSQARPVYLDDLLKYKRALKQRNEVLAHRRRYGVGPSYRALLESWDEELVALGARVIAVRLQFIETFSSFLEQGYLQIGGSVERPSVQYQTIGRVSTLDEVSAIEQLFRDRIHRVRIREMELGRTLIGPHLDEIIFRLDDFDVRRYASQGQHRSFGMALKLAQYLYLHDRLSEMPMLLLDDIFGSLDPERMRLFLGLLQTDIVGQSILTATQRAPFDEIVPLSEATNAAIWIQEGQIKENDRS